ncbi:MAG: RNA polymerase sigma factor [bacterium]
MANEDHELVRRALEGDTGSFDLLVEKYTSRSYWIALRMVNDPSEAEDLLQDAFLKAYQGLKGFRGEAGFFTWFCRILIHQCQDHLRKKHFRSRFSFLFQREGEEGDKKNLEEDYADPHWSSSPEKVMEQAESSHLIQEAISELPVRQRRVFILRHLQGLRIREIAGTLGISEGTIKIHLFRAVQSLRKRLGETLGDQP